MKQSIIIAVAMLLTLVPTRYAHCGMVSKLRIGVLPVVDTLPLVVGVEEGLFRSEGLDVELVKFQSALERDSALVAGKLDAYFGDIVNTLLLITSGQKIRIVTVSYRTDKNHRMFGIAVSPKSEIKSIKGLMEKNVAISKATIIEYLLDRILAESGFEVGHVKKLEIKKIPIRLQMLLSGQVESALLPEPLLTLAEVKGARVIADDTRLDTAETVIAFTQEKIGLNTVGSFNKAYAAAVARINRNPGTYKKLLIRSTRFPAPAEERYTVPVFPDPGPPEKNDVMLVSKWLEKIDAGYRPIPYLQAVHSVEQTGE